MRKSIQLVVPEALYREITAAAKTARQSRTAWVQVACEEKLGRPVGVPKPSGRRAKKDAA